MVDPLSLGRVLSKEKRGTCQDPCGEKRQTKLESQTKFWLSENCSKLWLTSHLYRSHSNFIQPPFFYLSKYNLGYLNLVDLLTWKFSMSKVINIYMIGLDCSWWYDLIRYKGICSIDYNITRMYFFWEFVIFYFDHERKFQKLYKYEFFST